MPYTKSYAMNIPIDSLYLWGIIAYVFDLVNNNSWFSFRSILESSNPTHTKFFIHIYFITAPLYRPLYCHNKRQKDIKSKRIRD